MINEGFCTKFFFRIPWNSEAFLVNIYPGLDFFYVIFWYFFLLLLWSIICHQLFLLLVTFIFGPMGKTATCLTPAVREFGHWFWKIGCDAHNLQSLNGLNGAQLCDWLSWNQTNLCCYNAHSFCYIPRSSFCGTNTSKDFECEPRITQEYFRCY